MTGDEVREARYVLGHRWGCGRMLPKSDMGRILGLSGRDPGYMIDRYEKGTSQVPPHVAVTITLYLSGATPPDFTLINAYRLKPSSETTP